MSTGVTAEQLERAIRDRDGWNGAVIRAARRILTTDSGASWLLNMRELGHCMEKFDQCAKAVQMLEIAVELEQSTIPQDGQPVGMPGNAKRQRRRRRSWGE